MQKKRCVNAAAYYIKELYKIREYTMIKKTKEKMEKNGWKFLVCCKIVLSQFLVKR